MTIVTTHVLGDTGHTADHNAIAVQVNANTAAVAANSLPPQAGNSGKFLTTSGSSPSWARPKDSSVTLFPEDYGAVGDDVTNDYAAFISLRNDIQTHWDNGAQQVIVQLDAKSYYISGALTQPDSNGGAFAVIPFRKRALSATRDNVVFQGPARPNYANGAQAGVQKVGATLRTDVTGGVFSSTTGVPSFIGAGGAFGATGSALQNTVMEFRNVCIRRANNPSIAGIDASAAEEMIVEDCILDTNVLASAITLATNPMGIGIVTPMIGNNAVASLRGDVEINGSYCAVVFNEHFNAEHLITYKSVIAMAPTSMTAHGTYIAHANCEWQNYLFSGLSLTGGAVALPTCLVAMGLLDIEDANTGTFVPTNHVNDASNLARITGRYIRVLAGTGTQTAGLTVSGGQGVSLFDLSAASGSGTWTTMTLINSWTSAGGGAWPAPQYRSTTLSTGLTLVECQGLLSTSVAGGAGFFTLPVGLRPAANRQFACAGDSGASHVAGFVVVQSGGSMLAATPLPTTDLDLSGVVFVAG